MISEPADESRAPAGNRGNARSRALAATLILAVLSAVWTWWALSKGAYFEEVLLPGGILLCATLAIVIGVSPGRLPITAPIAVAMAALTTLAAWSALSAIWSPIPDIAIADGQRIATYAIAFALGAWLCSLLGRHLHLALAPLAIAAGVAATATAVALLTSDLPSRLLEQDGTVDYPLGYRNANAAFFAIATFAAVGLAATRALDWRVRGVSLAIATICLDLVVLCQSRASLGAMPLAVLAFVLISPERLRTLLWLVLAALPIVAVLSPTTELYSAADDNLRGSCR